jgi:hypothetical protein
MSLMRGFRWFRSVMEGCSVRRDAKEFEVDDGIENE